MKLFGFEFTTIRELKETVSKLEVENELLKKELSLCEECVDDLLEAFPFDLGDIVYDVALKNNKGKYTKTNPSREYSTITEVEVTEKNYFSLVNRLRKNDVFFVREEAEEYLDSVCN